MKKLYQQLKKQGLSLEQEEIIRKELELNKTNTNHLPLINSVSDIFSNIYESTDFKVLLGINPPQNTSISSLQTLEELMEHDKQREKDGFPRRIRLGKFIKPSADNKSKVVVVPTTTEPKLYHDDSITEDGEDSTGGSGEGEEGEVIGEQQAQPQQGEGEGQGAGQGEGGNHEIGSEAFDLGKVLTEKFQLPNLRDKGKKRSFSKYTYDLTDKNRGFGQILDKKATLRKIVETNILLGNIDPKSDFSPEDLIMNPQDHIYRILSREKDFETQAVVFFVRDYSGSMQGKPSETISMQHLFIYSWLMYQYQNNVQTRFILHDTEAKEVADFYTYYKSMVAGGTRVFPAFKLVNNIIETEHLAKDYNIYVFYGTDGDDWDDDGKELIEELNKLLYSTNRLGITIAKNNWTDESKITTVEKNVQNSGLLEQKPQLIKIDAFAAETASEDRIIESIKKLVS